MKDWYLINSKPRQETLAQENLKRQGYETYLPITNIRRRKDGKTVNDVGPMFPRYFFIQLSEKTDDWGPIRSTFGVSKLVRFGHVLSRVPDKLISALKIRENEDGLCVLPERDYIKGEKIRIASGPFEGYEAIFQSRNSKDRVSLLLATIHKKYNVVLNQIDTDKMR